MWERIAEFVFSVLRLPCSERTKDASSSSLTTLEAGKRGEKMCYLAEQKVRLGMQLPRLLFPLSQFLRKELLSVRGVRGLHSRRARRVI